MGRHSKCPAPKDVIVSVAPSSIRCDDNGVLKVQCNIWFGSDVAANVDLNDLIRDALLEKLKKEQNYG